MKPEVTEILRRPAIEAAPLLLGFYIIRRSPQGRIKVKIVETEAYHEQDPASHSFAGVTARTAPMFKSGGRIYVYFTYGTHYCMNIVVGKKGIGEAVLIRAGQPIEGVELMQNNRGINELKNLTNGPGKLAQALGIKDTSLSGKMLGRSSIEVGVAEFPAPDKEIIVSTRIGITKATYQPWRFYLKDNPFVSRI